MGDNFNENGERCAKCGYQNGPLLTKKNFMFCSVCYKFCPDSEEEFKKFIREKANSDYLNSLREFAKFPGERQKKGMESKASKGKPVTRPPFGYKYLKGKFIPAENFREVEEIFEEFLSENISLRELSRRHNLSVNGLKKILKNFTYIGKIKFGNQIYQGEHKPIISTTLFNHVQNKLEKLGIK